MNAFTENSGQWSWRKFITFIVILIFALSAMAYQLFNYLGAAKEQAVKWPELPAFYESIILMVLTYYFGRRMIDGFWRKQNQPDEK